MTTQEFIDSEERKKNRLWPTALACVAMSIVAPPLSVLFMPMLLVLGIMKAVEWWND